MIASLAERAEEHPYAAKEVFTRMDGALNLVLPGSNIHERYREIEEVGLAAVVARDMVPPGFYNPLDPASLGRLSFLADNRQQHPGTWPKEVDETILGGTALEGMGRFTAFALAKINALTDSAALSSFRADTLSVAPGKVGFAGGRRLGGALLGISGLWEVHDHAMGQVYKDELAAAVSSSDARTVDDLAGRIDDIFARIKWLHQGVEAADLSRAELAPLLVAVDGVLTQTRARHENDEDV